ADGSVPTGGVTDGHGVDWDMDVTPDNDVSYLTSSVNVGTVEVEIEAWALEDPQIIPFKPSPPLHYRTPDGVWVQALGRWAVDCGCDETTVAIGGRATVGTTQNAATGTKIFFYHPDDYPKSDPASPVWDKIDTDAAGNFSLAGFKPKQYIFRPAGSGWDFLK